MQWICLNPDKVLIRLMQCVTLITTCPSLSYCKARPTGLSVIGVSRGWDLPFCNGYVFLDMCHSSVCDVVSHCKVKSSFGDLVHRTKVLVLSHGAFSLPVRVFVPMGTFSECSD